MLDTHGEQPVAIQFEGFAFFVQRTHAHFFGPFDIVVNARHRKATLFVDHLLVTRPDDLGVDEGVQFVVRIRYVNDDDPLMHVHLGGRETHAGRGVHGFGHIGHEPADAVVDHLHRLRNLVQPFVRVIEDVQ